ncbi:pyridoxal phosphate-dependent aminotransferase [Nocardioides turkmenicus]|uniref:pyridoxal phosphate-dependent aminotransferase n=1 Tax=Nocardioides turkmenicus TaxID=2711220 RepID=UPI0030B9F5A9
MSNAPLATSQRFNAVSGSPTLIVDSKAKALRAAGENIVSFGAGEPDFPTPSHIVEAAVEACRDPRMQKYGPTAGLPELRANIAEKTRRDSGFQVAPEQVLVTNGGKQAVFAALAALVENGDEVLVPTPYWSTYPEATKMLGGIVRLVTCREDTGFRLTVDDLDAAFTTRTKALVLASPSNPTGAVYTREQIQAIGRWALEHDVWIITDEIYEHLVYGDATFHSIPVEVPEMAQRTIVVNGVAKTHSMTGWRVGWLLAPIPLAPQFEHYQSHVTSHVSHVAQRAANAAVSGNLEEFGRMHRAFAQRRQAIHRSLAQMPGIECELPSGAFYIFPSIQGLMGRRLYGTPITSTLQLAEMVLDNAKVAFVPGEAFGAPGYARFSYALADDALAEGMERLAKFLNAGLE